MRSRFARLSTCLALVTVTAAAGRPQGAPAKSTPAKNSDGWTWLFDGSSMDAWRGYKMDKMPEGWSIVDGTLTKGKPVEDIITKGEWANFELEIEWKLGPEGNSGIFYRATEEYPKVYWSATEYQLLDDKGAPDGKSPLTSAASNYGLYPPTSAVTKPANEWNTTRIVVQGTHAVHWLNGTKVVEYDYGSADWTAKVKASKFAAWRNYGKTVKGHIAIQGDHQGMLALRNIRIRELGAGAAK
jgi:hypothetical protein